MFLAALATGCASKFDRNWKAAAAEPRRPASLEGAWTGRWISHSNGHAGRLRAVVTLANNTYHVHFDAEYASFLDTEYTLELGTVGDGAVVRVAGSHNMGKFIFWELGDYIYTGAATPEHLFSEYHAPHDNGWWELHRPEIESP